jgi:hypothetical protein
LQPTHKYRRQQHRKDVKKTNTAKRKVPLKLIRDGAIYSATLGNTHGELK